MVRRLVWLGLVVFAAAIPAAAQSTQAVDPDAATIQIGPIGITPSIVVKDIGRDNNVFNERDNPRQDFTATVSSGARILFKPGPLRVTYNTGTDYVYYHQYKDQRSTNSSSSVRVDFILARFQPYVGTSSSSSKERINSEVDERAKHDDRSYNGGFGIKVGSRLTVGAAVRSSRVRFDREATFRGENLARSFDSEVRALDVSAGLQLTPFTTFAIAVSREQQLFTAARERDSDTLRITPTFTFTPQAVLSGAISFGYRRFTPRSPALPAFSGLVAVVSTSTTLWNRHRVSLTFGRDLRYSYEEDTPYYLTTGGTLTITTQLAGPFDLRTTGSRQILAYRGNRLTATADNPGNDTSTGYGGGFGYQVRERIRLGINMEWSDRASQIASDREYKNRRTFVSLTWGVL